MPPAAKRAQPAKTRTAPGRPGTPAEKRQLRARGERTVRKLLDAGIEVFSRHGYHAARVDDIVKLAQTSHGTFYLYFSNKDDLFGRLTFDISEELSTLVEELDDLEPTAAGRRVFRAWLHDFLELYRHYGPLLRAWTTAENQTSDVGRIGTDMLDRFAKALAERLTSLSDLPTDPQLTALALVGMIERFSFFVLVRQVEASEDELVDALTDTIWLALFSNLE